MAGPPGVQIVRAPQRSAGPIDKLVDALADLFAGGRKRRLRRAVVGFERLASASANGDVSLARHYGRLVRLAARIDTHEAFRIVTAHDRAIPDSTYGEAFPLDDAWLGKLARDGDVGRQVAFEIASRLRIREIQHAVAGAIAITCAAAADRDALLAHLERCRTLELLDRSMVATALTAFVAQHSFANHSGWLAFLEQHADLARRAVSRISTTRDDASWCACRGAWPAGSPSCDERQVAAASGLLLRKHALALIHAVVARLVQVAASAALPREAGSCRISGPGVACCLRAWKARRQGCT